ncbi:MAG: FlgO family outer membrane protein, partial [Flavobacteriaceae bacterium]
LLCTNHSFGQDFDTQLEGIAEGLAKKISSKGKTKVAVWGFFTENGDRTPLGNYLTEDFSVYITNFGEKFEVIDRNHLDVLLKEHQLNAEGYIDENTAKELGKIVAVDAIITGTYTVLNSIVKVRAKVLDTETALQFAANMGNLPLNENIASYLGVSVNGGNSTNRGFNAPLSSNETINNPETVDSDCGKEKFGNQCFYNSNSEKMVVSIYYYTTPDVKFNNHARKMILLNPGETKCIYRLYNRSLNYFIATWESYVNEEKFKGTERYLQNDFYWKFLKDKGELQVETCKSKTYTIK